MPTIQIYEPALCCSTGVCGADVDPALVQLTADQEWFARQGVRIRRYNLSAHPAAFVARPAVRALLQGEGVGCLPLVLVDGEVVSRGAYPSRAQLEEWAGLVTAAQG